MSELKFNSNILVKLQEYSWYLLLVYFSLAVLIYFLQIDVPFQLGKVGLLIALGCTLLKLLLIAEEFRRIALKKFTYISYLLLCIICITIMIRLYL